MGFFLNLKSAIISKIVTRKVRIERSITLVELLIAMLLVGIVLVGIATLENYTRFHLISSQRRVELQNELSFILEDMSKNIIRATGDINDSGIEDLVPIDGSIGFRVRIDDNTPPTPSKYNDDTTIRYTLVGNEIRKDGVGLSARDIIINPGGFVYSQPPLDNGIGIEITLTGRYDTTRAASLNNPQLELKTKVYSHSASSN